MEKAAREAAEDRAEQLEAARNETNAKFAQI